MTLSTGTPPRGTTPPGRLARAGSEGGACGAVAAPADRARPALDVVVRDIDGPREMAACVELYHDVMGLRPDDGSLNPRLLIAIQANSGIVVGAYAGQELVGFAFSFLARDASPPNAAGRDGVGRLYQYSQLAVVARPYQSRGIGRLLKLAQRSRCLASGTTLMRWAFDPLRTRNAHVNLDVLGGRVTSLVPAMYGTGGFGDDTGESTDRFVVTWELTGPALPPRAQAPAFAGTPARPGEAYADGADRLVVLPDAWQQHREEVGAERAAQLRANLRSTFAELLRDHAAVSCTRVGAGLAAYRFRPHTAAGDRAGPAAEPHPGGC
ncbi:hypothetical protein [Peterkaempfera sp. SMS 1(5)a]|uniref:hypothetical protein n=1 Tax=Peterkaempfera podocarpi TaxID=3232308 RepID=UPI00366AFDC6